MLRQRIITAVIMLAVLVAALWSASPVPFIVLALVMMAAAAWEWARLNGVQGAGAPALGAAMVLACGLSWWAGWVNEPFRAWWLVVALWVVVGGLLISVGVDGWSRVPAFLRLALGPAALWVAWLAVVQARMVGVNFLLSVLALVAAADIAAYFAGRAFGGQLVARKLAPSISPNKSWEGVFGGMAGVLLLAALWIFFDRQIAPADWSRSLYSHLWQGGGLVWLVPSVMALAGLSVVGDLVESLVKRAAGAKDSSQLLPGHGGVLDRIDAQLPTLPFAMALVTVVAQRVA
ncbi:MAG TPA: phosphatidate cytidylyltransferase [Ottowia sp.]|uniref:phosphatidate cytidylyltransferase n=1 Tax=Ottowia sp. TaxID=1898956 RepID=UPI002C359214|nr:phosphatidate cytidylyltransferase [Ottowia sp.]HRN06926.1 phosphatidate cytidylyltransferase [Ottowia sp.]